MQSNHPCKEIVHFSFSSSRFLPLSFFSLFLQLTIESAIGWRKNHPHRSRPFSPRSFSFPSSFSFFRTLSRTGIYSFSLFLVDSVQLNPPANSSHECQHHSTCIGFSQLLSAGDCESLFLATCPLSRANWSSRYGARYCCRLSK